MGVVRYELKSVQLEKGTELEPWQSRQLYGVVGFFASAVGLSGDTGIFTTVCDFQKCNEMKVFQL